MRANNWLQIFHLLMKYTFNQHSSENECVLCMSAVFHSVQKEDHPLHQLRPAKESQCGLPHRCLCCESSSVTLEDDHFVDFNHHVGFERPQTIRTNWLWTVKNDSYVDRAELVLEKCLVMTSRLCMQVIYLKRTPEEVYRALISGTNVSYLPFRWEAAHTIWHKHHNLIWSRVIMLLIPHYYISLLFKSLCH